jgi:hypothetical protein
VPGDRSSAPVTQREFDMFVDQMKDEHKDNQDNIKENRDVVNEIKEKLDRNWNKMNDIFTALSVRITELERVDKERDKNKKDTEKEHRTFYIWLAGLTAVVGGGTAGMWLVGVFH